MVTSQRSIKSAERTLALFELFSREQRPFTVGHISEALKIPQPSTSMLLRNLTDLGYLEYDRAARTFAPSIRVALLGSWVDRRFGQVGSIGARLDRLQRKIGETAYLAIQNGAAAQYVVSQRPENPDRLEVESGQYRSLTCSAPGRALLSLKPDAEVLSWVRRCNAEATQERFRVRENEFMQLVAGVRRDGYATSEGDVTPGLGAVSMTFTGPMGGMPLAVGVGGPIVRMRRKRQMAIEALTRFKEGFLAGDDHGPARS
jgi:IclR family KDG regulon transcriptional repressor